jgi:hypothetical protein
MAVVCLCAAFHGALAIYLDRYLNLPPARLPRDENAAGRIDGWLSNPERTQPVIGSRATSRLQSQTAPTGRDPTSVPCAADQ